MVKNIGVLRVPCFYFTETMEVYSCSAVSERKFSRTSMARTPLEP